MTRMWSNLVLSIDIGTTSLKAALIATNGDCAAFTRIALPDNSSGKLGNFWISALKTALDDMKDLLCNVSAVCISGNGPTIISQDGTTLLWNDPVKSFSVPENAASSLFIPRLIAFKEQFPESWTSSEYIFSGPEYLIYRLTGKAITVLPEERYIRAYWSSEMLENTGIDIKKLPPFVPPAFKAGPLTSEASCLLNLPEGLPVFSGGPDFTAALIGTNTVNPGKMCDRAGSSEGINICTSAPITGEGLRTLPSVIPGLWNVSFLIPQTGRRISEAKNNYDNNTLQKTSFEEFMNIALSGKNMEAQKALLEISAEFTAGTEALFKAVSAARLRVNEPMIVTGGQAKSELWLKHKTDKSGICLGITQMADAELLGDAVLARVGLGEYSSIPEAASRLVKISKIFEPEK